MAAIYKRELKSYFHSMIGYVFIAFLMVFIGIYFMAYNLNYGYPYFSYVLNSVAFILLIAIPVLTMRSFAEERKNRTDQLLFTSPVNLFGVVMGKYLAMVTIFAIPCALCLIFPLIIKAQGSAYLKVDYLTILLFFLLGCVYIAIRMFISSLTESAILAAIGSFGVLLILYLWSGVMSFLPSSAGANAVGLLCIATLLIWLVWHMTKNWLLAACLELAAVVGGVIVFVVNSSIFEGALQNILGNLDLIEIFTGVLSNNLLDVSGIIRYLTVAGVFIFLTMQMIQKRRWS